MVKNFLSVKSLLKILVSSLLIGVVFSGCTTKIKMDKRVGISNLNFTAKLKKEAQTSLVIGIVDSRNLEESGAELPSALSTGISEILTSKGFKLKGPYVMLDDVTYRDKKMIYLAVVPVLNIKLKENATTVYKKLYKSKKGTYTLTGSLIISLVEPMTGQTFVKRRINLSDMNISEPFIKEVQTSYGDGSLLGKAIDAATVPDVLVDTSDVAIKNAINKFYSKAMAKIEKYIDREEILSFEKDILKLKGLKRF